MLFVLAEVAARSQWIGNRVDLFFGLEAVGILTPLIWLSDRSLVTRLTELFRLQPSRKTNFNRKISRVNGFPSRRYYDSSPWKSYLRRHKSAHRHHVIANTYWFKSVGRDSWGLAVYWYPHDRLSMLHINRKKKKYCQWITRQLLVIPSVKSYAGLFYCRTLSGYFTYHLPLLWNIHNFTHTVYIYI